MYSRDEKIESLRMISNGATTREVYDKYISSNHPDLSYESFARALRYWKKNPTLADELTLHRGTYPNFEAHGATVQVNSAGEVVQAWIKQHGSTFNMEELIVAIKENTQPVLVTRKTKQSPNMLEIPLYDMHFPLSDYKESLETLIYLITRYHYDEINLIIGQDLFHNDDFRGRTSSGRVIEKLDMIEAWKLAEEFWYNVIHYSLDYANRVNLIYSKGNHDETLAWAFIKRLEALFPDVNVDDTLKQRKCIHWRRCFIGLTHGQTKKNSDPNGLRSQFTIEFPQEFANSDVREIHAGHLHHEEAKDLYGVNIRRLSTAAPTDEWSDNEGYVGAHKRFMVFEWNPSELNSIHFI